MKPRQHPKGRRLKNASTTSKIQKASKRGNSKVRKCPDLVEQQEVHLENNESCTGEETVNQDLLLVARELNLSESLIDDQQNVLEKSQPVELNVSRDKIKDNYCTIKRSRQIYRLIKSPEWNRRTLNYNIAAV